MTDDVPVLNGEKFLAPLLRATDTIAYKIEKDWPMLPGMSFDLNVRSGAVLATLLRTATMHFRTGLFLVADQTREAIGWRQEFVLTLGLQARTNLEILFNVVFLLEDLPKRLSVFDTNGWREAAIDFEIYREDFLAAEGHKAEWARGMKEHLEIGRAMFGITSDQAEKPEKLPVWPTPGKMWCNGLNAKTPTALLPEGRRFLKHLYFRHYKPLSGEVHANGYGQLRTGSLSMMHMMPHEWRTHATEETFPKILGQKMGELAVFLLCVACDLQHFMGTKDVDIEARLLAIWIEMCKVEAFRDIFELRYQHFTHTRSSDINGTMLASGWGDNQDVTIA